MIIDGLHRVEVRTGARLMVHSSLKSFGRVDGGAATVIAALCETVGLDGVVMMPSFNHGTPFGPGGPGVYDPQTTPTTNGIVADTFWRMPGVRRSLNPTHPFAVWGADAQRYVEHHHRTLTMGPASPLGLLHADGGECVMLGTDHKTNTFKHVAETLCGAACLGRRTEEYPVKLPDGRIVGGRTWGWRSRDCPLTESGAHIHDEMEARGFHRVAYVGDARVIAFRLSDCLTAIQDILEHGRDDHPPCRQCPIRPAVHSATCPSDWNADQNALRPDSQAWTY
jgi:aminoglycoside N3'-acetyltransferase